ncbi:MAG: pyranose oxidase [Candidatus Nitrosocaldaceae archaeon]|nr:MAG: pyranose oxidase [Candidatus Nitrosocaldaceae archaeon]
MEDILRTQVFIAGSGAAGSTFARLLLQAGFKVVVADAGAQFSPRIGRNIRNAFAYQRNVDNFTPVVKGLLHPISLPPRVGYTTNLDPIVFLTSNKPLRNAENPRQDPYKNLDGAAISYAVGGMLTHWGCMTPRFHESERPSFIDNWDELYETAEKLLNVHTDVFKYAPSGVPNKLGDELSIRHTIIKEVLEEHYKGRAEVRDLPFAGERNKENDELINFTGADTILGAFADNDRLKILPEHRVTRIIHKGREIEFTEVMDLIRWRIIRVYADIFVIAAGAVLTPQILWDENLWNGNRSYALGRYLTEHPLAFTQVVLRKDIIDKIRDDPRFKDRIDKHLSITKDPIPIPMHDRHPTINIPVSYDRPFNCIVHRGGFHYGAIPPDVDERLIVDLRWFGMVEPKPTNRVKFETDLRDTFGMPKPTFEFTLSKDDRNRAHRMMLDMIDAANALGGFLSGAEPRFMPPGSSLHLMGTYRMGEDSTESVVDPDSKVWQFDNLYLGGNGVIPTKNASNPTLTTVALAVKAAWHIIGNKVKP